MRGSDWVALSNAPPKTSEENPPAEAGGDKHDRE